MIFLLSSSGALEQKIHKTTAGQKIVSFRPLRGYFFKVSFEPFFCFEPNFMEKNTTYTQKFEAVIRDIVLITGCWFFNYCTNTSKYCNLLFYI
jgi:hypothetical protein